MSQPLPLVLNDLTDIYAFNDRDIKQHIYKLPEIDVYTIVTAESPELLARRVRYFLQLNPKWIISGGVVISSELKSFVYRDNDPPRNEITVRDYIYHQTFIRSTPTTPAPASGGSIGQNSRKNRVQRKKRV